MQDDEQFIRAYLEGDERALGNLLDRYLGDLYNFVFRLTNDLEAAEDITQESFIKAWKNIRKFKPEQSFKTWLFTIARNTSIDWLRQKKDISFSSFERSDGHNLFVESLVDNSFSPDELIARAEDLSFVARLLEQLDPNYVEVLNLRHTSNMTFKEIGEVLKAPLHTVKSRYRRGIATLRRLTKAKSA